MHIQKIVMSLGALSLFAAVSTLVAAGLYVLKAAEQVQPQLAEAKLLAASDVPLTTEIFAAGGEKIGEFADEQRYYVPLSAMPAAVVHAFLSAEDKDFYQHPGISVTAIVRAAAANLRGGGVKQGASTITQQLARILFLDQSRTLERKVKEALLALALERRLSKDEILELYINKIYLGNHSYGIEAAARNYFRKHTSQLSIAEAALLAGLPKSPHALAPHKHPEAASRRQLVVLKRMEDDGFLPPGAAGVWAQQALTVWPTAADFSRVAPYVTQAVRAELARKFEYEHLPKRGLRIYTTLDWQLQQAAAAQLNQLTRRAQAHASGSPRQKHDVETALISLQPHTGAILAMQGGSDFTRSQVDRSMVARRPLGALFLPVYLGLALARGYTLLSRIGDDPISGHHLDGASGSPTLFDVLRSGDALAGAPLYAALGHGSVRTLANALGLHFKRDDLTLALGAGAASPQQVATAYAAFANGGLVVEPHLISRITGRDGKAIYEDVGHRGAAVLSAEVAYLLTDALRQAVAFGHAVAARDTSPLAAGMASCSEDLHDAWFVGMLPTVVSALWLGSEHGMTRLGPVEAAVDSKQGLVSAWAGIMRAAPSTYLQSKSWNIPAQISFSRRRDAASPGPRSLPFLSGSEPKPRNSRSF